MQAVLESSPFCLKILFDTKFKEQLLGEREVLTFNEQFRSVKWVKA